MPVKITLLDKGTGKTSEYLDEYTAEDKLEHSYIWTDGSYSCDCHRAIFFYGYDVAGKFPCGQTRFEITKWEPIFSS